MILRVGSRRGPGCCRGVGRYVDAPALKRARRQVKGGATGVASVLPPITLLLFLRVFVLGGSSKVAQLAGESGFDLWRVWFHASPLLFLGNPLAFSVGLAAALLPPYPPRGWHSFASRNCGVVAAGFAWYSVGAFFPDARPPPNYGLSRPKGVPMAQKVTPCLWFDGQAEQAARYYVSLLPDSRIDRVVRSPADTPSGPAGMVLAVEFTLAGNKFSGLNGGPQFPFTEAVSFQIACEDQAEVDRLWGALSDGGSPGQCGWLKDRWGLSWQIVPKRLFQLLSDADPNRSRRAMQAMLKMRKLDIAELERAADSA
jgi:predicted 3-demethylubiquinone-9 3-methyltransferase (glyoxalase superfamily)